MNLRIQNTNDLSKVVRNVPPNYPQNTEGFYQLDNANLTGAQLQGVNFFIQ